MGDIIKFPDKKMSDGERTIKDVFDTMNEEQKEVVYFLVGSAIEEERDKNREELMVKLTETLNKSSVFTLKHMRDIFRRGDKE
jgi:formylmethanofuran dehydrogenase subunit B